MVNSKRTISIIAGGVWCLLSVMGCGDQRANPLSEFAGAEVRVTAQPTVVTTSSTSQVIENQWQGKFVSADSQWVVIEHNWVRQAINRNKVIAITVLRPPGN